MILFFILIIVIAIIASDHLGWIALIISIVANYIVIKQSYQLDENKKQNNKSESFENYSNTLTPELFHLANTGFEKEKDFYNKTAKITNKTREAKRDFNYEADKTSDLNLKITNLLTSRKTEERANIGRSSRKHIDEIKHHWDAAYDQAENKPWWGQRDLIDEFPQKE